MFGQTEQFSSKELVQRSVGIAKMFHRRGESEKAKHAMAVARHIKRAALIYRSYY